MLTEAKLPLLRYKSLITANIYYQIPDYKHLVNEFIWQEYDVTPEFPRFNKFIEFWLLTLEGRPVRILLSAKDVPGIIDFDFNRLIN